MPFYISLLASRRNGTLYVGMMDDLGGRVYRQKTKARPGFTTKYEVSMLAGSKIHDERETAFRPERQLKEWQRQWKRRLIEEMNPNWRDLYGTLYPWPASIGSGIRRDERT